MNVLPTRIGSHPARQDRGHLMPYPKEHLMCAWMMVVVGGLPMVQPPGKVNVNSYAGKN